jgi:hypothetical protein
LPEASSASQYARACRHRDDEHRRQRDAEVRRLYGGQCTGAHLPGVNRVLVTFTDSGGTLRGETSVAIRTQ